MAAEAPVPMLTPDAIKEATKHRLGLLNGLYRQSGTKLLGAVQAHDASNAIDLPPEVRQPILDELLEALPDGADWQNDPALRTVFETSVCLLAVGRGSGYGYKMPGRSSFMRVVRNGNEHSEVLLQTAHPHDLVQTAELLQIPQIFRAKPDMWRRIRGLSRHHDDGEMAETFDRDSSKWRQYSEAELQNLLSSPDPSVQQFLDECHTGRQALTEFTLPELQIILHVDTWEQLSAALSFTGSGTFKEDIREFTMHIAKFGNLALKINLITESLHAAGNTDLATAILYTELLDRMVDARDFTRMHHARRLAKPGYDTNNRIRRHGARILYMGQTIQKAAKRIGVYDASLQTLQSSLSEMVTHSWQETQTDIDEGIAYKDAVYAPSMNRAQEVLKPAIVPFLFPKRYGTL